MKRRSDGSSPWNLTSIHATFEAPSQMLSREADHRPVLFLSQLPSSLTSLHAIESVAFLRWYFGRVDFCLLEPEIEVCSHEYVNS